jgi:hypothetical protein
MTLVVSRTGGFGNAAHFDNPQALSDYLAAHPEVKTIVFVIWSWKVPPEMLKKYRCIGMHTGPLLEGKGRGGSPIRNLQALGVKWATLCAFEMTEKFDEGQVKVAIPIDLEGQIIRQIDAYIPCIISYLTQVAPEIPAVFKRIKSA